MRKPFARPQFVIAMIAIVPVAVHAQSAPAADLVVQSPSFSKTTVVPGEAFTFSATVKNQGASITITAPSSTGIFFYGACVDSVVGESNTGNNCSSAKQVTVAVDVSGDGVFAAVGEECDDGGTVSGDGCSAQCQVEALVTLFGTAAGGSRLPGRGWCQNSRNHAARYERAQRARGPRRSDQYQLGAEGSRHHGRNSGRDAGDQRRGIGLRDP